jgi:hypothetical protein
MIAENGAKAEFGRIAVMQQLLRLFCVLALT